MVDNYVIQFWLLHLDYLMFYKKNKPQQPQHGIGPNDGHQLGLVHLGGGSGQLDDTSLAAGLLSVSNNKPIIHYPMDITHNSLAMNNYNGTSGLQLQYFFCEINHVLHQNYFFVFKSFHLLITIRKNWNIAFIQNTVF